MCKQIRPIAICTFRSDSQILVFEAYDAVEDEVFYRPLGGGIRFGEHSSEALVREINEELGADISKLTFLGSLENIFVYNGEPGHELVQVYNATFNNPAFYEKEEFEAIEDNGEKLKVLWKDIADFKKGQAMLYPNGLLELLIDGE